MNPINVPNSPKRINQGGFKSQPKVNNNNNLAGTTQTDSFLPSPDGTGEGPSVVEKLFKKMGDAWKSARPEPTSLSTPSGNSPLGTGEFLSQSPQSLNGEIKTGNRMPPEFLERFKLM